MQKRERGIKKPVGELKRERGELETERSEGE